MIINAEKRLLASNQVKAGAKETAVAQLLKLAKSDPYDSDMIELYNAIIENEGKKIATAAALDAMLKTNLLDRMLETYERDQDQYDDPTIKRNLYEFLYLSSAVDTGKRSDMVANALVVLLSEDDDLAEALQREFADRI
jgi:hypothetical protein